MTALDWISAGLLLASLVLGAWRGLLYEVVGLIGWLMAFVLGHQLADWVGHALPMGESPAGLRRAAGFVLVFIGVAFVGGWLAAMARRAIRSLGLRPVDRLLGAGFGALRGLLLLLLIVYVVEMSPLRQQPGWQESASVQWLKATLQKLAIDLPEGQWKLPDLPDLPTVPGLPQTGASAAASAASAASSPASR